MQEFERGNILKQYEVAVNSTRKARGAILCNTDQGVLVLESLRSLNCMSTYIIMDMIR